MRRDLETQLSAYGEVLTRTIQQTPETTDPHAETVLVLADHGRTERPITPKQGPWVAVAAFALVLSVGLVGLLFLQRDEEVATPPFESPVEAAQSYVMALNSGDVSLYSSLMSADAIDHNVDPQANTAAGSEPEKALIRFRAYAAEDLNISVGNCVSSGSLLATCEVTVNGGLDAVLAGGPYPAELTVIIDEEGLIETVSLLLNPPEPFYETSLAFRGADLCQQSASDCGWLGENHPELASEWHGIWGHQADLPARPVDEIVADVILRAQEFTAGR